jgi:hypothetical protein
MICMNWVYCCLTVFTAALLWRPTSPGNEDVLICINAPFMIQRVLKSWWLWTYQNSTVKRASARAIPGWVTSWEVWLGSQKRTILCHWGWVVTNGIRAIAQPEMVGACTSPMRDASGNAGSKEGVIVTSHIAWEWGCAYMYKCTIYDTTRFKAVMVMNLSELHS